MKNTPATTAPVTRSIELSQDEKDLLALVDTPIDFELERLDVDHISQSQKLIARARLQQMVLEELQRAHGRLRERKPEITYGRIARRLRIDPALVSRRMSGCTNMTMDTAADMFLAMEECPVIFGVPVAEPRPCGYSQVWPPDIVAIQTNVGEARIKVFSVKTTTPSHMEYIEQQTVIPTVVAGTAAVLKRYDIVDA
jgi:hypothetical protein